MARNGRKTAIYQSQILGIRLYVPDFARKLSSLIDATAILFYEYNFNQQDCFAKKKTIKLAKIRTILQKRFQPIAQVIKLIHTGQNWGMKYTEYRYKAKRLTTCIMLQFKFSKNATKI